MTDENWNVWDMRREFTRSEMFMFNAIHSIPILGWILLLYELFRKKGRIIRDGGFAKVGRWHYEHEIQGAYSYDYTGRKD